MLIQHCSALIYYYPAILFQIRAIYKYLLLLFLILLLWMVLCNKANTGGECEYHILVINDH